MLQNVEVPEVDLAIAKTVFHPQDKRQAAMVKIRKNIYNFIIPASTRVMVIGVVSLVMALGKFPVRVRIQ